MVLLIQDESDKLVNLLLNKMSNFGINYKISRQNTHLRTGQIPNIDIETVEKSIVEVESLIKSDSKSNNNESLSNTEFLISLYTKVVEL